MHTNVRACRHLTTEDQIERIEMPLARLLVLMTHLAEASWDLEGMKHTAKYVV